MSTESENHSIQDAISALSMFKYFADCEASGLGEGTYPVEIGVAWFDGKENQSYQTLVKPYESPDKPEESWTYWNSNAQGLHGLKREDLVKDGVEITVIAKEMNKRFKNQVIWVDSVFDIHWIEHLFHKANVKKRFLVKNILKVLPEILMHKLLVELPPRDQVQHRALEDAIDLKEAFERVVKFIDRNKTESTKEIEAAINIDVDLVTKADA
ncbi:3'-5' exoribonuclease [Pseudomonas syringae pv. actinidiae]|nr:3'-5' exoribonuclease [Pseudomonas syringae pv. actinidiae]